MSLTLLNPRHRRSPKNLLLNDVFTDWDSGYGVFSFLERNGAAPWENVDSGGLDIAYHGEHSGEKFIAPMVYHFLDEDGEIHSDGILKLSSAIKARYYQKWEHLWQIYTAEYSPLNTYNITESGERDSSSTLDETDTRTPNLTESHTGTDNLSTTTDADNSFINGHVITDSGTDTTTTEYGKITTDEGEPSSTTVTQVYGFNSTDPTDKSKVMEGSVTDNTQTLSGSDETEVSHGMVETHSGTDRTTIDQEGTENRTLNLSNRTTGTDTNVRDNDQTSHEEFSTTKQGTMYRAPGELLSLDRDFWLEDYFGIIFSDVDHMLTLGIYSDKTPNTKIF